MTKGKSKVFIVSCEETELSNIVCATFEEVGDIIEGDLCNAQLKSGQQVQYTVQAKLMSNAKLENLQEYEP